MIEIGPVQPYVPAKRGQAMIDDMSRGRLVPDLTRRAFVGASVGSALLAQSASALGKAPIDRTAFPALTEKIYLDAAHRAPAMLPAVEAGRRWLNDMASGANSIAFSDAAVELARISIARALGSNTRDLAFVQNTTTGLNIALNALNLQPGTSIVIPEQEYNGIKSLGRLAAKNGITVIASPVDGNGRMDMRALDAILAKRPAALIFSWVGFSTGARADIDAIGAMCRTHGVVSIADTIQATGFSSRPLSSLPVDAATAGAHKGLLAPPGIGILWIPEKSLGRFHPHLGGRGTFTTEDGSAGNLTPGTKRFEYGNVNQIGIAMLSETCSRIGNVGLNAIGKNIANLCGRLYDAVKQLGLPIVTPGDPDERCHIVTVDAGAQSLRISHELGLRDLVFSKQSTRLRFSVGSFSNEDDIEKFAAIVSGLV